jgi:aminomethyltransferase
MLHAKTVILKFCKKTLGGKYKMILDDEKSLIAIQGPQSSKILEELIPRSK